MKEIINPKQNYLIVLSIFFFSIFTTNVSAAKIRSIWYKGFKYVYIEDVASFYGMNFIRNNKYCVLSSKYSKIKFNYGAKRTNINNVVVYTSYPVVVFKVGNSQPALLNEKDFILLLDPILRKNVLVKHNVKTVVIDPGHGGKDPGALGRYSTEKDLVLSISRKLAKILIRSGYKVILTRNRDVFLSLESRPVVCERFGGDIFISIHANAVKSQSVEGIEAFIYAPEGTASTYGGSLADSEKGNKYSKNNTRLGYDIQKQLSLMQSPDRGLKHSRFKVLKLSPVPAVLIELGFISSPSEEYLLRQEKYQDMLAYRIARGIVLYSKNVK